MQTISSIMTACPVVAHQFNNFSQVLRLFTEYPVHHLPVVDGNNKLIGIISTNDLPKVFMNMCSKAEPVPMTIDVIDHHISIKDLMTPNPVVVSSTDPISKAAEIFSELKFMALPVVDNGVLVGIVSLKDMLPHLNHSLAGSR